MHVPLNPSLAVDFCGLRLASPIVLLSGCVGFGEEYTRVEGFSNRDAGAIVIWFVRNYIAKGFAMGRV